MTTARGDNLFGLLRLGLATLVVFSHSWEMLDSVREHEILRQVFGTVTIGEIGLDGFFLISGYLITRSWETSRTRRDYLGKRVLRIYPGFVAAFLVSLLVVGPLAGGDLATLAGRAGLEQIVRLVFLHGPQLQGAFAGLPEPQLNSPLWTIAYEFRCYLGTLLFGALGLMAHRRAYLALTAALLLAIVAVPEFDGRSAAPIELVLGRFDDNRHFFAVFGAGALFYLYRDRVAYRGIWALLSVVALAAALSSPRLAVPGIAVFGGYALFWLSFQPGLAPLRRIGTTVDLSYGLYLYAWPVQNLLIGRAGITAPWLLFVTAMPVAALLACFSWFGVERRFLRLRRRFGASTVAAIESSEPVT